MWGFVPKNSLNGRVSYTQKKAVLFNGGNLCLGLHVEIVHSQDQPLWSVKTMFRVTCVYIHDSLKLKLVQMIDRYDSHRCGVFQVFNSFISFPILVVGVIPSPSFFICFSAVTTVAYPPFIGHFLLDFLFDFFDFFDVPPLSRRRHH